MIGDGGLVAKSCLSLVTPWDVTYQAPLSLEFPRQEYWSESPFLSPGVLPNPVNEPGSHALQANSSLSELPMDRGAWWAIVQGGHKQLDTTEQIPLSFYSIEHIVKQNHCTLFFPIIFRWLLKASFSFFKGCHSSLKEEGHLVRCLQ